MTGALPVGTLLTNGHVRVVVVTHDDGAHIVVTEGQVEPATFYIEDNDIGLWTVVPSEADREVETLRAEIQRLRAELDIRTAQREDALRKASDLRTRLAVAQSLGAQERAAIVAWMHGLVADVPIRNAGRELVKDLAEWIEYGHHEVQP